MTFRWCRSKIFSAMPSVLSGSSEVEFCLDIPMGVRESTVLAPKGERGLRLSRLVIC